MSITSDVIIRWLNSLPVGTPVGIDDGGLTLQMVDSPEVYLEVGGLPREEIESEY